MFDSLKQKLYLWKEVFSKDKYQISFVIISFLLYLLNSSVSIWGNLVYTEDFFDIVKLYTYGYYLTVGAFSFYVTFVLGLLTGFLLSLLWYRADLTALGSKKKLSLFDYFTIFFGIVVPGCPSCGLGLIAVFGLGASVAALPFGGVEILILAIFIVLFAIYRVSHKILTCDVVLGKV